MSQLQFPTISNPHSLPSAVDLAKYYWEVARIGTAAEALNLPRVETEAELQEQFDHNKQTISDYLILNETDEFMAKVCGRAFELATQGEKTSAAVVGVLAVEIARMGVYTAHPSSPKSLAEFLAQYLGDREDDGTRARALGDLAEKVLPMLKTEGLDQHLLEIIAQTGIIDKLIQTTWYVKRLERPDGTLSPDGKRKVREILADLADPKVSTRKFREKHGPKKDLDPIVAHLIEQQEGKYVVIPLPDARHESLVKERLGKHAEWRNGDGISVGRPGLQSG